MTLNNEQTRSQLREIRQHLLEYGTIDKPTALELCDCDRLGARVYDLRAQGMPIKTVLKTKKNRFGHLTTYAVYKYEGATDGQTD